MIGEIFLQPHIYLHSRQGFRMACILAPAALNTYQFPPQTSIGTKTDCFQLHFDHLFLVLRVTFAYSARLEQNSQVPQYAPHVPRAVLHHKFGQASRTHFYITYGKRTASVNHPAQFIRSHLTIQKMRGCKPFSSESSDSPGFSYQS